jgi:hypothetical protein
MAFMPINSKNSTPQNYGQLNDIIRNLNKEQVTKTFKQPNGNSIVNGRLPNGRYGSLYYDSNNDARILIGQHPTDGRMIIAITKSGIDVIDELGS